MAWHHEVRELAEEQGGGRAGAHAVNQGTGSLARVVGGRQGGGLRGVSEAKGGGGDCLAGVMLRDGVGGAHSAVAE